MDRKTEILSWLGQNEVPYQLVEHPAAYDMQDIVDFQVDLHGPVAKNLFLRDSARGKQHFVVTVRGDKRVDLQALGALLGQRLSFASENRLQKFLNLQKGEVTPLSAYYDSQKAVQFFMDQDLLDCDVIGVHPCDNTATVFVPPLEIQRLLAGTGHTLTCLAL